MSQYQRALEPSAFPATVAPDVREKGDDAVSPARMLLAFLDRNLCRFSPFVQNTIGLGVMTLLFIITLHASVAPTFVSGKLFTQASATDDKEFAKSYMIEYNDTTSVVTDFGSWMLPIRGGVPRRITLRVLDSGRRLVGEAAYVGPWPVVSALYPMELQLTVQPFKSQGERIQIVQRTPISDVMVAFSESIGFTQTAYAQTLPPRVRAVVHLEKLGNVQCSDGGWCGTKGENRRLEGFALRLASPEPGLTIKYLCYVQDTGDTEWLDEGQFCGRPGEGRRVEGFAVRLEGPRASVYDVLYQAHVQDSGDSPVGRNGSFVGTRGESRQIEAIKVWIDRR